MEAEDSSVLQIQKNDEKYNWVYRSPEFSLPRNEHYDYKSALAKFDGKTGEIVESVGTGRYNVKMDGNGEIAKGVDCSHLRVNPTYNVFDFQFRGDTVPEKNSRHYYHLDTKLTDIRADAFREGIGCFEMLWYVFDRNKKPQNVRVGPYPANTKSNDGWKDWEHGDPKCYILIWSHHQPKPIVKNYSWHTTLRYVWEEVVHAGVFREDQEWMIVRADVEEEDSANQETCGISGLSK